MLAVFALLLNFGAAQAQYSVALPVINGNLVPFYPVEGSFGPRLPYNLSDALPLIGDLVDVKDIKGNSVACDSIAEDLTGKIAIIDRGTCGFVAKCLNAVKKGALAVLVANNATGIGVMGGATDPNAPKITVPCMMISQADGAALRAILASSTVAIPCVLFHPNSYSDDAFTIKPGKYKVDGIAGHPTFSDPGAVDTINAREAAHFVYFPTQSGKISVSSCDGKGDTYLNVYEADKAAPDLTKDALNKWTNGGACAKDAADTKTTAAELKDIPVKAGLAYYIEFSDRDDPNKLNNPDTTTFFFNLGFVKRDSVTIKLSVDMKSEAAVDAAGVHVAGSFQGWDPKKTALTNVAGTKIYEGTFKVAADQTIEYKFVNGDAWGKDESVANTAPCAAGKDGNRKLVVKTEDITIAPTPCFKSCEVCITPAADFTCDAAAVICDPFKSYANGALANGGAAHWATWDDAPATAASPVNVSSEQFASDTKSGRIDGSITPGQDVVFKTGNLSKGHYTLGWKMFIPTTGTTTKRKHAYYNIQKDLTGNHVFSSEVYYLSNGTFEYRLGTGATLEKVGSGKYDADKWFNISHDIDIDKDTIVATVNGIKFGWKWSRTSAVGTANKQLAGINFYADSTYAKYFVDDIQFIKLPDPKAKVTFSVDMKNETVDAAKGVCVAGNFQAAAGLGADWTPGAAKLVNKAGTSIWELTTELPTGNYEFKFINDNTWDNKKEEKMAGKGCYAGDNRTFSLTDLNAKTVGTYCYNSCYNCNQREVTFIVDMSKEATVFQKGVSIAGNFQAAAGQGADWTPGVLYATRTTGRIYVAKAGIPAGTYEYKFVNGDAWGKDEKVKDTDPCAAGKDGNRKLVVGTVDMKLDTVCFKHCVICSKVISTNDPKFDSAMTLFPNPAQDVINLNYEFNATTSLKVSLVNILGQTVYTADMPEVTSGTAILDIHNLTSGTYMIQITDQNSRQSVKRFVIER